MEEDFTKLGQSFICDTTVVIDPASATQDDLNLSSNTNESVYVSFLSQQGQDVSENAMANAEDIFINLNGIDVSVQSSSLCQILLPDKQQNELVEVDAVSTKEEAKLQDLTTTSNLTDDPALMVFSYGEATVSEYCLQWLSQMMSTNLNEFMENLCKASLLTYEWCGGCITLKGPWNSILQAESLLRNLCKDKFMHSSSTGIEEEEEVDKTVEDNISDTLAWDSENEPKDSCLQERETSLNVEAGIVSKQKYRTFAPKKGYEALTPFKHFCHLCSFKSKRESHFKRHLQLHEKNVTVYRCTRCSFRSIRLSHVRKHEVSHSTMALQCSLCSYSTDQTKLLKRHLRKHKQEKTGSKTAETKQEILFPCSICAYRTTKFHLYQRHLKVHSTGNDDVGDGHEKPFQCEQCDYQTWRKEHYTRHVRAVHMALRNHLCQTCGKAFKRRDGLTTHQKIHMKSSHETPSAVPGTESGAASNVPRQNVSVHSCKDCRKSFRTKAHLLEHMTVHSSNRDFLCEICGASFKTRSVQRKHVASIHQRPRSYACNKCLKRFNTNFALRRHSAQHQKKEEPVELGELVTAEELEWPDEHLLLPVPVTEAHSLSVNEAETLFYLEPYQS